MVTAMELLDDLAEEIFFRIHPADATTLVRAALVCKRWCRLIADPGFRRRLREHHRVPPMLGFSSNIEPYYRDAGSFDRAPSTVARFVRTSSCLEHVAMETSRVVDTRHGRVLLVRPEDRGYSYLSVWDPITKEEHKLPWFPIGNWNSWNAAVFCTAAGCEHLDCHGKPFAVVFVYTSKEIIVRPLFTRKIVTLDVSVYSSEAGTWRSRDKIDISHQQPEDDPLKLELEPSALVGNALYFGLRTKNKLLKYSIGTRREVSTIDLPHGCFLGRRVLLMAVEDGGLGFATVRGSKLYLWSMTEGDSERWAPRRVIDLNTLLPVGALKTPPDVVGYAYGVGYIFLKTDSEHFRIDLKSGRVKKVRSIYGGSIVFPYMSFHTPALGAVAASTDEGQSMGASSA